MEKLADDIRIGTLVRGGDETCESLKALVPMGFESFQINFWKTLGKADLTELGKQAKGIVGESEAVISSIGIFGNPLGTSEEDRTTYEHWKVCIENAHHFGTDLVCGFAGGVEGKPVPESISRYAEVFGELAALAADKGVSIAFENCPMGSTWSRAAMNIAYCPDAWTLMFDALPTENVGLEWEPCHQMCQLIDPLPQLREWLPKVIHVHGKDASVDMDAVRRRGVHGDGHFALHRTPGFGDTNWTDVISILRQANWKGSIDIEGWHDPVYKGELEMTGQLHGLRYLKQCRGGSFVPNPPGV